MAKTPTKEAKKRPEFGPAMSPAIFCKNWLSKFRDLVYFGNKHEDLKAISSGLEWSCLIASMAMAHLLNFYSQAKRLQLKAADFPTEPEVEGLDSDPMHVKQKALVAKVNPFDGAMRILYGTDFQLYMLKRCKHREKVNGMPWQALPFEARQNLNDMFEKVAKAEEDGWWPVKDSDREEALREVRKDEQTRIMFGP